MVYTALWDPWAPTSGVLPIGNAAALVPRGPWGFWWSPGSCAGVAQFRAIFGDSKLVNVKLSTGVSGEGCDPPGRAQRLPQICGNLSDGGRGWQ